jgi:hypothetical protein
VIAVRTRFLAVLAGWLFAVASVAAIASFAINTAGRQVTSGPISAPRPLLLATSASATETKTPTVSPTSRPKPKIKTKPVRSTEPVQKKTRTPSVSPTVRATQESVGSTYFTIAGRVRVVCTASRITLAGGYVQPNSGWAVSVQSTGPARVQVLFTQEHRRSLKVVAICLDGRPRFGQSRMQSNQNSDRNDNDGDRDGLFQH